MLNLTELLGFGAVTSGALSLAYIANYADATNTSVYTYAGSSIGTAASDRHVIVGACGSINNTGFTISGVTCGGVAMTEVIQATYNDGGQNNLAGLYRLNVTSGTTADIVVTYSGALNRSAIVIWTITGPSSAVPTDTLSATGTTNAISGTIDYSAGGALIALAYQQASATTTWSANLTENVDVNTMESNTYTGASKVQTSSATGDTVTATFSGSDRSVLVAASWL